MSTLDTMGSAGAAATASASAMPAGADVSADAATRSPAALEQRLSQCSDHALSSLVERALRHVGLDSEGPHRDLVEVVGDHDEAVWVLQEFLQRLEPVLLAFKRVLRALHLVLDVEWV